MAVAWGRGLSVALLLAVVGVAVPVAAQGTGPATRLIVKFKPDAAKRVLDPHADVAALEVAAGTAVTYERALLADAHLVRLPQVRTSVEADAIAARLEQLPQVEYAERSRVWKAQRTANDTYFASQFYLHGGPTTIDAVGAWDLTTGSPDIVVAVIDSGIRPHADLALRVLPGYDFITDPSAANDGDERDADPHDPGDWIDAADVAGPFAGRDCDIRRSSWHGTSVTGAIAANGNNERFAAGVDWSARILPLRALGKCGGDDFDIAEALAWAGGLPVPGVPDNPHPAHVVNMSLGGPGACPRYFQHLVNLVLAKGFTRAIVAGSGNDGSTEPHSPSDCTGVLAVTSTRSDGTRAGYANFGPRIDIAAPGGDADSSGPFNFAALSNSGRTVPATDTVAFRAGTSFATPLVSGVAALMLSLAPQLSATQLRDLIKATVQPFAAGSNCTTAMCGTGVVNAANAVRAAAALAPPATARHRRRVLPRGARPLLHHVVAGGNRVARRRHADEGLDAHRTRVQRVRHAAKRHRRRVPHLHPARTGRRSLFRPRPGGVHRDADGLCVVRAGSAGVLLPVSRCRRHLRCRDRARVSSLLESCRRESPLHDQPPGARRDGRARLAGRRGWAGYGADVRAGVTPLQALARGFRTQRK